MEDLLLSLLLYAQMTLGGTEICFESQYMRYARPKIIAQWVIDTEIYEYIGSVIVDDKPKPIFTYRMQEI